MLRGAAELLQGAFLGRCSEEAYFWRPDLPSCAKSGGSLGWLGGGKSMGMAEPSPGIRGEGISTPWHGMDRKMGSSYSELMNLELAA